MNSQGRDRARSKIKPLRRLINNLKRLRHRKGYGVHSPYVYTLVREVFAKQSCDTELYDNLTLLGLKRRHTVEVANFIGSLNANRYAIDPQNCRDYDVVICTTNQTLIEADRLIEESRERGVILIITSHNSTLARELHFMSVVQNHISTSIDKGGYLILINSHLPKQHFIL